MNEIAEAIQEGAMAYIKRQFRTILFIVVPLAVIVFVTSTEILSEDGSGGLSTVESGLYRTLAFLGGCLASAFIGYLGMWLATRANVRTAAAAKTGTMDAAMQVAFRAGGTIGLFTAGLGLLGATVIVMVFQNTASAILVGFGFGGSLLALFLRVGGGIFTKAADVGADLVGKVEAGIPEDDPRNPATIADNVGDNVGDCAGHGLGPLRVLRRGARRQHHPRCHRLQLDRARRRRGRQGTDLPARHDGHRPRRLDGVDLPGEGPRR